jgi:hypothetical protein
MQLNHQLFDASLGDRDEHVLYINPAFSICGQTALKMTNRIYIYIIDKYYHHKHIVRATELNIINIPNFELDRFHESIFDGNTKFSCVHGDNKR